MILVHGTRLDSSQWDGYEELLSPLGVITVDLPGHGTRAGDPWSWEAALAAIDDAVAAAREDPVILVGHSLGGYLATDYAAENPWAVDALVLIGATADPSRHPRLAKLYRGFAAILPVVGAERMAGLANMVMRGLRVTGPLPSGAGYAVIPEAWADVLARARVEQMTRVCCPVFLLAGQFDQMRLDLQAYAGACRHAHVQVIPRATHLVPLSHQHAVARALTSAVDLIPTDPLR